MASNHTSNYGLSQWEATDGVLRVDFNEDNAKIDAALKGLADQDANLAETLASQVARIEGCGNCKIVYGTYMGTDKYGASNPNTLTFSHKPTLIFIQCPEIEQDNDLKLRLVRGIPWAIGMDGNSYWKNSVTWTGNSVRWYNTQGSWTQFNTKDIIYHYVALLATDE